MPLNIRSDEANRLAEQLAAAMKTNKTEAVKSALRNELQRVTSAVPLLDRLRPLQQRIAAFPLTGLEADKAFYDELSGDP
jgi:antitoxin VapB